MQGCQCPDCSRVRSNMDHLRKRLRGLEVAPASLPPKETHHTPLLYLDAEMPLPAVQ